MHVKKGDQVLILSGQFKNGRGRVLKTLPEKNKVIVEGFNFKIRHTRPSQRNPQGGRVEKEAPIHASNVKVISEG
jgi:large subunit ribosomal protein L24